MKLLRGNEIKTGLRIIKGEENPQTRMPNNYKGDNEKIITMSDGDRYRMIDIGARKVIELI